MKFFILLLTLFAFSKVFSQTNNVTIIGELKGCKTSSAVQFVKLPIHDPIVPPDTTFTDSKGCFKITFSLEEPCFCVFYSKQTNGFYESPVLFIQPGREYQVISELNDSKSTQIKGANSEGLTLLQSIVYKPYIRAFDIQWNLKNTKTLLDSLHAKIESTNSMFQRLYENKKIDSVFYNYSQIQIRYYYANQLECTIANAVRENEYKSDSIILQKVADEVYKQYPLNGNKIEYSIEFYEYVDLYLSRLARKNNEEFKQYMAKGLGTTYVLKNAKNLLTDKAYQYYAIRTIWSRSESLEQETIDLFENYKNEYSDNIENRYYQRLQTKVIPEIRNSFDFADKPFSVGVTILDKNSPINSFNELISQFKGKPVFIDCWASWCRPCKAQFRYKKFLEKFLADEGIELIYIAYEYNVDRNRWCNQIKKFNLLGNHVLITQNLKNDLNKRVGTEFGLPTYLIVDKNGDLIEATENRPNNKEKLFLEVKSMIKQ
ncbi:TlpA family protein disulfide reductase [Marinilabiliaceae bacterium JC017]|nr:TlpA family protein disulfide reductase [Marinilabiliaceae bacterium JC017]